MIPQLPAKPTGLPDAQNKHGWAKEKGLATVDGKIRTPVLHPLPPGFWLNMSSHIRGLLCDCAAGF